MPEELGDGGRDTTLRHHPPLIPFSAATLWLAAYLTTTQESTMAQDSGLDPSDFYRTDHMGMATWLKIAGHSVQRIHWTDDRTCYWYFDKSDPLLRAVDEYLEEKARVEPKEYNRVFKLTKDEFWSHSPEDHPGRRSSASQA